MSSSSSSSSSLPPVVPQHCLNAPLLYEFLRGEEERSRVWLRNEMNQIPDPLIDSLFHGLIMSSSSSAVPQSRLTVPELCGLLEGQKVETRKVLKDEMDRLVNTLFDRLTNKLRTKADLNRSDDGEDRAQAGNLLYRVESANAISNQPSSHIAQPSTSSHNLVANEQHSNGNELELNTAEIIEIKEEVEDGEETRVIDIETLTEHNQSGAGEFQSGEKTQQMDCVKQEFKEEFDSEDEIEIKQEDVETTNKEVKLEIKEEEEEEETQINDIDVEAQGNQCGDDESRAGENAPSETTQLMDEPEIKGELDYEQEIVIKQEDEDETINSEVKLEIKKEEEEDGETQITDIDVEAQGNQCGDDNESRSGENGPMDWVKQEIKEEEEDGEMLDIKKEEEEEEGETNEDIDNEGAPEADEVNRMSMNNLNGQAATDIDSLFDRSMRDEFALHDETTDELITSDQTQNRDMSNASTSSSEQSNQAQKQSGDDESRCMENAPMDTTPAHLTRQSQANKSRHAKRKQKVPQAQNELTNRDNQHVNDEDKGQIDEVSSRRVKRPKMDSTQANNPQAEVTRHYPRQATDEVQSNQDRPQEEGDRMASGHEPIGQDIATECTTNPTQPNLAQPNRHWQCPQCPKSFDRYSKLKRHLVVHSGERAFPCDQCGKRFTQADNLAKHQLIHQNIKRFRCNECDKQFTQKRNLDSHLLTHSGERPFECRHCEKSFSESVNRNKHEQAIHLQVKPNRCKQCGHTATHRSHLITHIRVVHFGLPPTIKEQRALNIVDDRDPREFIEKV